MSPYSTRYITQTEAESRIAERLPLATNSQHQRCLDLLEEYIDPTGEDRADRIEKIQTTLAEFGLDKLPSQGSHNMLVEILGNIMDVLFKEETLNNYCVIPDDDIDRFKEYM